MKMNMSIEWMIEEIIDWAGVIALGLFVLCLFPLILIFWLIGLVFDEEYKSRGVK